MHIASKFGVVLAGTFAAMAGANLVATTQAHGDTSQPTPRWERVACVQEDSPNCYWDAQTMGNHVGHSFWSIPVGSHRVATVYWDPKYNHSEGFVSRTDTPPASTIVNVRGSMRHGFRVLYGDGSATYEPPFRAVRRECNRESFSGRCLAVARVNYWRLGDLRDALRWANR